ncbi:MAG: tubulin-like doman-containing protein [Acidobacteriota bacterium]
MPKHRNLVVDELLTKPSAVSPTLFVGLGGCGMQVVSRVARHLHQRGDDDRYRPLVKFALVDTNINDLESHRDIADETFLVSDFEKEAYADLAAGKLFLEEDPFFTQWVPRDYRFRAGDTAGAGQIRIESRLGAYYQMKHRDMVPRFRQLLEELKSHEHGHRRLDSSEIRIILCYSVAGGTGSGSHLPVAYMLRDLASDLGKPWLIGVAVLPAVFEDKIGVNKDGSFANGYAALKETEHLMRLGAPESAFFPAEGLEFHYNPSDESRTRVRQKPFEFVYVIDKPESFSVADPVAAAADGLYLQFFSPLFGRQASDYDNYTQHQRFLVPHDFEAKGIQGFTSFYGSFGAAVLRVPVDGLIDYSARSAALALMRANFVRDLPSDKTYASVRERRDAFDEVTLGDAGDTTDERPIHRSEFGRREPMERDRLRDRLFAKRVRLLAAAEIQEGKAGRFLSLFRHGHSPGEVPRADGSVDVQQARLETDRRQLAEGRMRFSIGALVLAALTGDERGQRPGLLVEARRVMERLSDDDAPTPSRDTTAGDLFSRVAGLRDDMTRAGRRLLADGYRRGTLAYPGLDSLVDLDFLRGEAAEVDLAAKRYAILRIRDHVEWDQRAPEPAGELDAGGEALDKKVSSKDAPALVRRLVDQALDQAMVDVERHFIERLGELKTALDGFASVQRTLEQGYAELEREQERQIERLRIEGEGRRQRYILDAEALRSEDGRRLWDFYVADRIAGLPELSLQNEDIQRVLADTVTDLSVSGVASTSATLERLFDSLRRQAEAIVRPRIAGDPKATERERREGLTLSDALQLEVVYRALHLSDARRIEREGQRAIAEIVAAYSALPAERKEDLGAPIHQDYLRDKVKRVVKEKASLLCVYEDSRDQHGGVRPDHIFLAAIDEDFKNTTIAETLRGVDLPNLEWVSTGWHNEKEIIFYRAVLNVPLYVFGRLDEMKHHYHRFRGLAKRSKVLHIDKEWEHTLPDLDPVTAQEVFRQRLVRDQIVSFAALASLRRRDLYGADADDSPLIVRRSGRYFLTPPGPHADVDEAARDVADPTEAWAPLGVSLSEAIEALPSVLESEPVKYLPYQQMLRGVRRGLAPEVLRRVAELPFRWRRNRDELRTQYGSSPSPEQRLKLDDSENAFRRLHEALASLLERLRNREIEQRTLGEDVAGDGDPAQARRALRQSIEILRACGETWHRLEHPDEGGGMPRQFVGLFEPLDEDQLSRGLESLRSALAPDPR